MFFVYLEILFLFNQKTMQKTLLLILNLFWLCFVCKATGQMGERMIIGKDTFMLLTLPLEADSVLSGLVRQRLSGSCCTGCWRGYQGEWELVNGVLYLNKLIDYKSFSGESAERQEEILVDTDPVFDAYQENGRIKASWFSGELRLAKGEWIHYIHAGFFRVYPEEWFYQMKKGVVQGKLYYRNSFRPAHLTLEGNYYLLRHLFRKDKFPGQEDKRWIVSLAVQPKADGSLDSLRVATLYAGKLTLDKDVPGDTLHPYWAELTRCLQLIPDWDVLIDREKIRGLPLYTFQLGASGGKVFEPSPQLPDTLCWQGESFALRVFPLQMKPGMYEEMYDSLKQLHYSEKCNRGYIAKWQISDGRLYLVAVWNQPDGRLLPKGKLSRTLPLTQEGWLEADWFSGELQLFDSSRLDRLFWPKNLLPKQIVQVEKGRIVE